jgi:hypothetical protein
MFTALDGMVDNLDLRYEDLRWIFANSFVYRATLDLMLSIQYA